MDSVVMMIFMLSFASGTLVPAEEKLKCSPEKVTIEQQKEAVDEIPFPNAPPSFHRSERIGGSGEEAKNDAEMFWEVTKTPGNEAPPEVVDGNHPDNYEITTHDHVDRTIGHVPPTKRVKKILPPFEGRPRNARHIDDKPPEGAKLVEEKTGPPARTEEATTENVTDGDATTPPEAEDEIRGIRLVPKESEGTVRGEGEEGEEEESTVEKSIWDLLKEREQFNSETTQLDGMESSENGTTELPTEKPKSLYDHFDADSEEVAFETENFNGGSNIEKHELPISYAMPWLQVKDKQFDARKQEEGAAKDDIPQDVTKLLKLSQNEKSVNGVSVSIINSGGNDYPRYGHRPSKWYLLLLTGNSTIVKLRRKDFAKYLKLNLAARLSVEYDDVKVNKVILAPPKVLVNISVFSPSDDVAEESQLDFKLNDKGEAPLYRLAETNATLLELSGEEYHVIRFLSLDSQKPEAEAHKDVPGTVSVASRQTDVEFVIYTFVGSACACAAVLALFVTLTRYYKRVSDFSWLKPKQAAWKARDDGDRDKDEFDGVSPAVIYSGGFPQIRGSWMGRPAAPPFRRQPPRFHLGASPPGRMAPSCPDFQDRPCASPRHSKLQIFNCDADSLVIPMPVRSKGRAGEGGDTRPLDVRISGEGSGGQDNPIFTN